ncbi:MAG: dTDP-4-amino-4,6-dideoxygalactose transaminase [Planctomycetota bacterium]|nr:dTDP-4-amino-4,6-dideoxygalactose transaminase [Planctomycetota bacterium]
MTKYRIPFNKPSFAGNETRYIAEAIERGHISGDGHFTKACHKLLEESVGVPRALLTTNCTHALEMSGFLVGLEPGDEVIVPSFAFVTTVLAFVLRGAKPVFCDVRADTLNLDETQLEQLITKKTKAIVTLHYAGVACEMDAILAIAARHGIPVIEDNAHGLFAKYKGRQLGTLGLLATQSFHETKNFTCGEGGALFINDRSLIERAEILREKGTNRSRFMRGLVHKYTWVDVGSSYLPSDMLAAFLLAQLEARDEIQAKRGAIWKRYARELAGWAAERGVSLPHVPQHCEQPFHMFYLLMKSGAQREALITHLEERGILAVFHYLPLHMSDMGKKFGGREGDCPVTENVSGRLLRLPFFNRLTDAEQGEVIEAVKSLPASS